MPKSNLNNSATLLFFLRRSPLPRGYTLTELLVTMVILGVLSAMAMTLKPWYENPLRDSNDRLTGVIKSARARAISTTSTYRISPDSNKPTQAIQVQRTQSGNCEAATTLSEDIDATDTDLPVASLTGFSVGDKILIGSGTTKYSILSINPDVSALTLGSEVGSVQAEDTSVVLVKDWKNDSMYIAEDLTMKPKITLAGEINGTSTANWSMCINSRGFVTIYKDSNPVNNNLELVLTNTQTNEQTEVLIYPGGAIEASD